MMKTTQPRHGHNRATHAIVLLSLPICGCLLLKPKMSPVHVIVADVFGHQTCEMALVEYDHMIEQFTMTAADEPFRNAILPGTAKAGAFRLDAEALHCIRYIAIEVRGPIQDQVLGDAIIREGFAQLLRYP